MAMPWHKISCPMGHEIYKFGRSFLGYYYYTLRLSNLYPRLGKKIIAPLPPKLSPRMVGRGA